MVGVIVGSKKTGINPDNVATPIAASFGDLITLAILAWISQGLYNCLGKENHFSFLGSLCLRGSFGVFKVLHVAFLTSINRYHIHFDKVA